MTTQRAIGVLGAGPVGQAVADKAIRYGHEVLIGNSRGPKTLEGLVGRLGPQARAVTAEEAAKPELVFLSVPFFAVPN
jgi:hypothetical protein